MPGAIPGAFANIPPPNQNFEVSGETPDAAKCTSAWIAMEGEEVREGLPLVRVAACPQGDLRLWSPNRSPGWMT